MFPCPTAHPLRGFPAACILRTAIDLYKQASASGAQNISRLLTPELARLGYTLHLQTGAADLPYFVGLAARPPYSLSSVRWLNLLIVMFT